MIVTEAMIAPYRVDGKVLVQDLPDEWFTASFNLYWPEVSKDYVSIFTVPVLAFVNNIPELPVECEWIALVHQCGGLACSQEKMVMTRLSVDQSLQNDFIAIAKTFDRLDFISHVFINRDEDPAILYKHILKRTGLKCLHSAAYFKEALYPVDYNSENMIHFIHSPSLSGFTETKEPVPRMSPLPKKFDFWTYVESFNELRRTKLARDDAVIFILSENSD